MPLSHHIERQISTSIESNSDLFGGSVNGHFQASSGMRNALFDVDLSLQQTPQGLKAAFAEDQGVMAAVVRFAYQ